MFNMFNIGSTSLPEISNNDKLLEVSKIGALAQVQRLFLLNEGVDVNCNDGHGWTAIMHASYNGHVEVIKALLEHNANVNMPNNAGSSALMNAIVFGHIDCVRMLVENGADVTLRNKGGSTAKDWAQQHGHLEIVNLLTEANIIYLRAHYFVLSTFHSLNFLLYDFT